MSIESVVIKRSLIGLMSLGFVACSYVPSTSEIFPDQKEAYKNAHELPSLEIPPELSSVERKDEYSRATTTAEPDVSQKAVVQITPLEKDSKTSAEIIKAGNVSYLLVHDGFRNTWRNTVNALEQLGYDIEDRNRDDNLIYLNINEAKSDTSMLSSLSFWKKSSTTTYLIGFDEYSDGIAVEVKDEDGALVSNDVSERIYADLLKNLTK